jgi:hypothetical protein
LRGAGDEFVGDQDGAGKPGGSCCCRRCAGPAATIAWRCGRSGSPTDGAGRPPPGRLGPDEASQGHLPGAAGPGDRAEAAVAPTRNLGDGRTTTTSASPATRTGPIGRSSSWSTTAGPAQRSRVIDDVEQAPRFAEHRRGRAPGHLHEKHAPARGHPALTPSHHPLGRCLLPRCHVPRYASSGRGWGERVRAAGTPAVGRRAEGGCARRLAGPGSTVPALRRGREIAVAAVRATSPVSSSDFMLESTSGPPPRRRSGSRTSRPIARPRWSPDLVRSPAAVKGGSAGGLER